MMNLEEIEKRCNEATEGPWEWVEDKWNGGFAGLASGNIEVCFPNHRNDGDEGDAWFEDYLKSEDAEFIARSREDVPWLIAEVKRLRKQLELEHDQGESFLVQIKELQAENERLKADLDGFIHGGL